MTNEDEMLSTRQIALSGFLLCIGVVTTSIFLGYWKNLESCLLCNSERVLFVLVGFIFLIASVKKKINNVALGFFALFFALLGAIISAWQVYLQIKPIETSGMCLPPSAMTNALQNVIHESGGECAQVLWKFLGLSMAAWALVVFVFLFFLSALFFVSSRK